MRLDKPLQYGKIRPRQLNIALQEAMDALRSKRKASDCIINLTDGDGSVIARVGASFDNGFAARRNPTDSKSG
jgi:transcriptional regulator of acetoin/glycerol metabolism